MIVIVQQYTRFQNKFYDVFVQYEHDGGRFFCCSIMQLCMLHKRRKALLSNYVQSIHWINAKMLIW